MIYAVARGERDDVKAANGYFTSAFILGTLWALILWVLVWVCEEPLLRLFGANDALMPLCKEYMVAPKLTVPVYVFINLSKMNNVCSNSNSNAPYRDRSLYRYIP